MPPGARSSLTSASLARFQASGSPSVSSDAGSLGPVGVVAQQMGDQMDQESPEVIDRHRVEHRGVGVDLPPPVDGNGARLLGRVDLRREERTGQIGVPRSGEDSGRRHLALVQDVA